MKRSLKSVSDPETPDCKRQNIGPPQDSQVMSSTVRLKI